MRNALILLAVVALLILVVGALNNGTAFDVDYVAGTVSAVSLFWVSAVIAALVFVVGLVAAWFAQAAVAGTRRKLEAELQSTYERLREAEALAARPAPAVVETAPAAATVVAVPVTVVAPEWPRRDESHRRRRGRRDHRRPRRRDRGGREDETVVADEDATEVAEESGAGVGSRDRRGGRADRRDDDGGGPGAGEAAPADAAATDAAAEPRGGEPGPAGS